MIISLKVDGELQYELINKCIFHANSDNIKED